MKTGVSYPSCRKGYLAALAVAILTVGLVHGGQYFSAKQLRTTAGFSEPVDVNASSFGCKSPGSWSSTVWCTAYGSTYESHVAEANRHAGIIVMYKNSYDGGAFGVPSYGDFYTTGNYGSSAGGFDKDSVVHCPAGATMQYHTSSHHKYSPSLGRGFYDGDGGEYHYWCESGSVAVNPIKGGASGTMPDYWSTDKDWLVKYQFPNGLVKYKRGNDTGGWYKCQNSYAGPFEPGVNQYLNSYYVTAANKKPYYRCLSADGASYVNAVDDFDALPAPYYGVWTIVFGLDNAVSCSSDNKTCQSSCAAGDSTCGGAGTYGASTQKCASNTYWCQTTDPNTRYCSASAVCALSNFTPPAPTWALANPTGVGLNPSYHTAGTGGNYVIETDDSIYMTANVSLTGTGQPATPNKVYRFKISNSQTDFSNPRWNSGLLTSATSASTIAVITPAISLGAGGPWYICVEVAMNNDNSTVTLFDSASQKTACVVSSTSFTTIAPVVTTTCDNDGVCESANGETTGTCAADCTTSTACNNNGVCDSGESSGSCPVDCGTTTSCPAATPYRCADNSCAVSSTSCTGTITLNGTIFKDGQYVDPATLTLRNCVSPNYWMKEGPLSSGARGFHCMPNTPSYTLTSDHYPPTPCTGTLWAGSSFSADYCATSKDSTINTCPAGQNWDSARNMCVSSDWQRIVWNTLGLESYVSINAPQSVIDAAKVACANTPPSQVFWPNPSDFTRPATAGIPDCSGTRPSTCDNDRVCEANETAATCPTDCGDNPIPPTGPKGCAVGETCSVSNGDWCNSGRQCFGYSNGAYTGNFTCNNWSTACDATTSRTCPANDLGCIESGSFGSATGYCRDAMECYAKDGTNRKYCQPYSYNTTPAGSGSVMTCPASVNGVTLGSCSPNSPDCVELNATRTTNITSASCAPGSIACYSADETTLFCQPFTGNAASMSTTACPVAYPNKCRPGDRYCTNIGENNTEPGANCVMGARECWSTAGLSCVAEGQSCLPGSGACRTGSVGVGCIEPGSEGPIVVPGSSGTYSYCGGRSISCYKSDGLTMSCQAITNPNDPFSWEKTTCPTGSSRCRPDDQYCCEIGETCSRGSWCTSGMRRDNTDGTVTCVAKDDFDDVIIEPPVDERVCIQVTVVAYNPTTLECKNFATPCNVPDGWKYPENGEVCVKGVLMELDVVIGGDDIQTMTKMYEENVRYLTDLSLQLMYLTTNPAVDTVKNLIPQGLEELAAIKPLFPPRSVAKMEELKEKLRNFHTKTLAEIETKMTEVRPFIAFASLRIEIKNIIDTAKVELSQTDPDSEYFINLSGVVKKIEELLHQGESQITNIDGLKHIVELIHEAKVELKELIQAQRGEQKDSFLATFIDGHLSLVQAFNLFVADKEVTDMKVTFMLGRFEEEVNNLKDLYTNDGDYYLILQLTDEVAEIRMRLERWLAPYGYRTTERVILDMVLSHVETVVQERVAELFKEFTAIIDEAIQNVVIRFAEIVDQVAEKTAEQIVTSVNNIMAIAVEDVRNGIAAAKDSILQRVAALNEAIENADLAYFSADRLRALLDYISTINWCGDVYQSVQADINSVGLALENDEAGSISLEELETSIHNYAEDNVNECYRIGAANFRMLTHAWYFPYAEYNYSHGYIKGYTDNAGNRTGMFGESDATLRIEALTMAMRLFGISVVDASDPGRDDIPPWAFTYYNGALDAGIGFDNWVWDTPITRLDAAKLLLAVMLADDEEYITVPTGNYTAIDKYPDRSEFASDDEAAQAVEVWTDLEVFQGAGDSGKFNPYSYLLRSEFAAVVQRIDETLGVSEEVVLPR